MKKTVYTLGIAGLALALSTTGAKAATDCVFVDDTLNLTLTLQGNCTTDASIGIPNAYTLDGAGYTITALDPAGDHFKGAVVRNSGVIAHVHHLNVSTSALANVCDAGADRLRGIMFEGATGSMEWNTVSNINQGPSGCQEGNAIEVRNEPFDGTHPNTHEVQLRHNTVTDYQKTGIVANGDVVVDMMHNTVGASMSQNELAANAVQYGFGATGVMEVNFITGNQWLGLSDYAASAVLLYLSDFTRLERNSINGNSDVGIYAYADNMNIINNKLNDVGTDGPHGDIGIGDYGTNHVSDNRLRGFDTPYDGLTELLSLKSVAVTTPQAFE